MTPVPRWTRSPAGPSCPPSAVARLRRTGGSTWTRRTLRIRSGLGSSLPLLAPLLLAGTLSVLAQSSNPAGPLDFSAFKIISDRNIFDPNRRPHVSALAPVRIVDSFSLVGTMMYGKGRFAVFDGTGPDYRRVLEPGASIAGHAVTEVCLDAVKLAAGTNQVDMKVGMQMRRKDDGQWLVAQQSERLEASSSPTASRRRSGRRSPETSLQREAPPTEAARAAAPAGEQETTYTPDPPDETDYGFTIAPPETAGDEPNDPVARMMRRRAQELNGNDNRTPNP